MLIDISSLELRPGDIVVGDDSPDILVGKFVAAVMIVTRTSGDRHGYCWEAFGNGYPKVSRGKVDLSVWPTWEVIAVIRDGERIPLENLRKPTP